MPISASVADASADRSSSDPVRVFGSAATISSSEAPIAEASADAEPPPGAGSEELNAARTSRTGRSTSMDDAPLLDDGADEIDRRSSHHDRVHLLARLEAAHTLVAIERVRRVDRRPDERLLEREV